MRYLTVVVGLFIASIAHAEPRRSGNIVYDLPSGWETRDDDGLFHNVRPGDWLDRDDYPDIYMLPGEPLVGGRTELHRWALQRMDAVVKDDDNDYVLTWKQWQPVDDPAFAGKGFANMSLGMGVVQDDGRFEHALAAVTFTVDGHAEVVYVQFEEVETSKAALNQMLGIVGSFRFINRGATPLEGTARPGPFDGIYWGTYLGHGIGLDGMLTMEMRHSTYVFFPDGRFCEDIPPGGVSRFDYDRLAITHSHLVGTYSVDGEREDGVTLRYASGETDTLDYEDGELRDGQAYLRPVNIPPDGWRFEGSLSFSFYHSFSLGVELSSTGSVSGGTSYAFEPDGTVTSDSWTGGSGSFDGGGGYGHFKDDKPIPGTYEVSGGVLTITRPDGTKRSWDIFITEYTDSDTGQLERTLWIGGDPADGINNVPPGVRPTLRSKPINPLSPPTNPLERPTEQTVPGAGKRHPG